MVKEKILAFQSLKILRFPIIILILVWILKFIVENILKVEGYRNVFNAILLILIISVFVVLLYITIKRQNTIVLEEEQEVRGVPLILWAAAISCTFFGGLLLGGGFMLYHKYGAIGFIPGILFFSLGVLLWFESLTIRIVITKEGLIVKCHKIFPFPGLFYAFEDIEKIKIKWKIVHLKHKTRFMGAKRFLIFNLQKFRDAIKKCAPDQS